jgi:hypothetical protein
MNRLMLFTWLISAVFWQSIIVFCFYNTLHIIVFKRIKINMYALKSYYIFLVNAVYCIKM